MSVGGACCLCSALVGSAHRAALRPQAPLLAIFWGPALSGNKDNRTVGRCSRWDEFKKKVEVVIMDVIKALYAGHAYNALCICTGSKWGRAQAQISSLEVCCSTKKKK